MLLDTVEQAAPCPMCQAGQDKDATMWMKNQKLYRGDPAPFWSIARVDQLTWNNGMGQSSFLCTDCDEVVHSRDHFGKCVERRKRLGVVTTQPGRITGSALVS